MGNRARRVYNPLTINIDRITIQSLTDLDFGEKLELNNHPLGLTIVIEKACEVKNYDGRDVVYDLKKFIITDNGDRRPFRKIELEDKERVKKYASALHTARLRREVMYNKLLIEKDICIGDVVKRKASRPKGYLVVLPFKDTEADRLMVNCMKLDMSNRLTNENVNIEFRNVKRIKSIKIRK